ncbi:putative serine peptidase [Aspergillus clavatus NRRL 1]|uniref:Serine peptidase, putative n=1 Tax=Aspergillus clavatus (strain ATCC 1007 / CBS 513.65 / DSM 816 / NCTC 3887 / NRRL 1 / QM 1276 / 107) TaxID=344612 RepID=A1CFV7_ASPCL|nr:serine peptidase, putative [Aspergillus clavatus NRRL 1]EAW11756.1 serine peptidase, putative [Aspergillus clavatus NRRL 1]
MRSAACLLALGASYFGGIVSAIPQLPVPPPFEIQESSLLSGNARFRQVRGNTTFDQLIDHDNPELGTFQQRFWWSSEFWKGPGSPVVLFTPGEADAPGYTGYLTNQTLPGRFAQEIGGAVILLEHRYWGTSSPYTNLNTETLQYLTLEQSIADLTHFAKTVDLAFDSNHSSNADKAPWVLTGGSYSGALSAWTASTAPGTFWAYHSSSAPVEAIYNFWQYFVPVVEGMPRNCSMDVSRVVEYVDQVYKSGDKRRQQKLKEMFGLGALQHFDDFAAALENGPWLWQSNSFYTGYSEFYQFCDMVENVQPGAKTVPGPQGVGLEKALKGYASWFKSSFLPGYCAGFGYWTDKLAIDCFDTHKPSNPIFTDQSLANTGNRQWTWLLCNEPLFYWQDGAPPTEITVVSRLVSAEYWQRQCQLYFPEINGHTYGSAEGKRASDVNKWTKGWDSTDTKRLIWTNGQYDPWRDSGVSSVFRPGGPLRSTKQAPVQVIPGGFHCSDLRLRNGQVNAGVQKVIDNEVAQIKAWVKEYPKH